MNEKTFLMEDKQDMLFSLLNLVCIYRNNDERNNLKIKSDVSFDERKLFFVVLAVRREEKSFFSLSPEVVLT